MTLRLSVLPESKPGQFVHLGAERQPGVISRGSVGQPGSIAEVPAANVAASHRLETGATTPLLRRAFSIAGLTRATDGAFVEVIYRVIGTGTRWMESRRPGDPISLLGPLGNGFSIHKSKPHAWLVAGGVGLPPMLFLAEALQAAGKCAVAFCGAKEADLLPLELKGDVQPAVDATRASDAAVAFTRVGAGVVISTDDGSLGFRGHVGAALAAYHKSNPIPPEELVVYTCGPDRMMQFVADYCLKREIECYACMERMMACGVGTCQSCVVSVHDQTDPDGWRYRLCCTEGPVFDARQIIWDLPKPNRKIPG